MTASFTYARSVIDRAYAATKTALSKHLERDTEDYATQDKLLANLQSLRAAQTALSNAAKAPIVQHVNSPQVDDVEDELVKALGQEIKSDIENASDMPRFLTQSKVTPVKQAV